MDPKKTTPNTDSHNLTFVFSETGVQTVVLFEA